MYAFYKLIMINIIFIEFSFDFLSMILSSDIFFSTTFFYSNKICVYACVRHVLNYLTWHSNQLSKIIFLSLRKKFKI